MRNTIPTFVSESFARIVRSARFGRLQHGELPAAESPAAPRPQPQVRVRPANPPLRRNAPRHDRASNM